MLVFFGDTILVTRGGSLNARVFTSNWLFDKGGAGVKDPALLTHRYDGTTLGHTLAIDGTMAPLTNGSQGAVLSTVMERLHIGNNLAAMEGAYFKLSELIAFNGALGMTDIMAVEHYLTNEYDLAFTYSADDTLIGGKGNDLLDGGVGNDSLEGGDGDDTLEGGAGEDTVNGGMGNDMFIGGSGFGNDIYNGNGGIDTIDYSSAKNAIEVDLGIGDAKGDEIGDDSLANFENIYSGDGDDSLMGNSDANVIRGNGGHDIIKGMSDSDTLIGGAGNDTIDGGLGPDSMIGGSGTDTADYTNSAIAVKVTINGSSNTGGDAQGDSLAGFENLTGSANDDTLTGDSSANFIQGLDGNDGIFASGGSDTIDGGAGNDTIEGSTGGDSINGGDGIDEAAYGNSGAVNVTINSSSNSGSEAAGDSLTNIENLAGSGFDDTLTGDGFANAINGAAGKDTIDGDGGSDTLTGGAGDDTFDWNAATDSTPVSPDKVLDFVQGDDILDFFNIAGTFTFIGGGAHSAGGGTTIRFFNTVTDTFIDLDSDDDGVTDMLVELDGVVFAPVVGDFIL